MEKKKISNVNASTLEFLKDRVLTISDLTRTKKLTEILNSYADKKSNEVFVVQNSKNKEAQAVISDLDFFQELLEYKEAIDEAIDEVMYSISLERKDDKAGISLAKVINEGNLDIDRIISLANEVEEDV